MSILTRRQRPIDVMDITRAYEGKTLNATHAARQIARISPQRQSLDECKHGLRTFVRLNDAPCCPLCMVDHGYATPYEVRL